MLRVTMHRMKFQFAMLLSAAFCVSLIVASAPAMAQSAGAARYPNKPIKLVVPFVAGGSNDLIGRFIVLKLGERLGQQFVVDNKGGGNSLIGTDFVAKAPPDGYTLLIISGGFSIHPAVFAKLPYDPLKDFTTIATIGTGPNVIAVWPGLGVNSVKELIALAKSKPGGLNYASSGLGSTHHFTGELFKQATNTEITHVPYKGGGQSMIDVMSGQVQILVNTVASALGHFKSGKLKAVAVDSASRASVLPDVPMLSEILPGYEGNPMWWGIVGPANMPNATVVLLNREINAILKEPEAMKWLNAQSAETMVSTPEEFKKRLAHEIGRYKVLAKAANIRID